MITGTLKGQIDRLWLEFHTGGITNPLSVIEQISYLLFSRLLDQMEARAEQQARRAGRPFQGRFSPRQQHLRWSRFRSLPGEQMLELVRTRVFPHLQRLGEPGSTFGQYLADAVLLIHRPSLLVSAVRLIDQLPLERGDTQGDLYEYALGKLTTAGISGQFRTPRHIIRLMVELIEPQPTEVIGDPACGTAGFLVGALQHVKERYSSPELVQIEEDGQRVYPGDLLEPYRRHIQSGLLYGWDLDPTMLRIAAMNLLLHGIDRPAIHALDTLSSAFPDRFPHQASAGFDVILANPPFKGRLDESDVHPSLTQVVKTKKTELLFLALMLRMLKPGGRCACIVPDGVLFNSTKAHLALRRRLLEENHLEGIVALPSGVFKPYAGVSTAILLFRKGGRTDNVWFYRMESDGLSLDDKREPVGDCLGDLPDIRAQWLRRRTQPGTDRTARHFVVPAAEIRGQGYDLSISRYREPSHEEQRHDPPRVILARLRELDDKVRRALDDLEGMLG
jgi:type I restriction enzyme M protein